MSAIALQLHFVFLANAGGLWRDETGLVNIASLPSVKEIFDGLLHDHCPMVYPLILRTWMALGLGHTDLGLRIFGLCVGLSLVASFWAASRMMGKGLPLLSLAIVALNPTVIRYGDAMRAYALGMIFIIVTMGLVWRFIEVPNVRRGLPAGFAAVISVQTLYQNAFFLLAICIAGIVVSLRQRQRMKAAAILGIGFVAALSLTPYIKPIHEAQTWWVVSQAGVRLDNSLDHLHEMAGPLFNMWLAAIFFAAIFGLSRGFISPQQDKNLEQHNLPLFGAITLVLGAIGFGVFIKLSGLQTQVWYYVPVFCFTAICCDVVCAHAFPVARAGILAIAATALTILPATYPALQVRQTNGDLMAAYVSKNAAPDDLIIVNPWYYGLTFARYYQGAAKWTTLPPIADYRFHRYDLIKEKLQTPNAIQPVLQQTEKALHTGHRIWIVGKIPMPAPDAPDPGDPPPAPGTLGWGDEPYIEAWGNEFGYFLIHHATHVAMIADRSPNPIPVNPMEKMTLSATSGWNTNSP
jgi:hypothetical protein